MKAKWTADGMEYRATLNGAECVVRPAKEHGLIRWSCSVHRERNGKPIERTVHDSHTLAMRHAEGVA